MNRIIFSLTILFTAMLFVSCGKGGGDILKCAENCQQLYMKGNEKCAPLEGSLEAYGECMNSLAEVVNSCLAKCENKNK